MFFINLIISIKNKITWVTIEAAEELPGAEEVHHAEAEEDHPGVVEVEDSAEEDAEAEEVDAEAEEGQGVEVELGEVLERGPKYLLSHIRDLRAFMF